MSTVIIILLFLSSSYLTLEKYIVTGHIFRPRTSGKNTPETIKERSEQVAAEVSEGQELIVSRPEKGLQRLIIKDNHWGLKNIVLI